MGDLLNATNKAIRAATHLGPMDAGTVAAIRSLAQRIDVGDVYFKALAEQAEERKLRPPSVDNVSIPTYLKYAESLGLSPVGRVRAAVDKAKGEVGSEPSSLAQRRASRVRSA